MHNQPNYTRGYADYRRAMMRYANGGTIPAGVDPHNNQIARDYRELDRFENPSQYNDNGGKPMSQQQEHFNQDPDLRLPDTVADLFPSKWLSASDLNGRTFNLVISRIEPGMFPIHPRTRDKELKAVAYFFKATKGLILNATQCTQIAEIAESERFDDWPSTRVTLAPGKAPNGKDTIIIRNAPPPANKETPQAPATTTTKAPADETPADDAEHVDAVTGELFTYHYGDGALATNADHPAFDSYRRTHDEKIPPTRAALVDWVFKVKKTYENAEENPS